MHAQTNKRKETPMPVILINPFEVPKDRETDALAYWEKCADILRKKPGFISTKLHKAIAHDARFRFVNVAEWESSKHFQQAVSSPDFLEVAGPGVSEFPHYPGLYEVVRT